MPSLRRHRSDSNHLRSSLADAAWEVEDRVVWGTANLVREAAGAVEGPFERVSSAFDERVVRPIEEMAEGWSDWLRRLSLALVGVLAVGAAVLGVVLSGSGGGGSESVEVAKDVGKAVVVSPAPIAKANAAPDGPVLHGVKPDFAAASGGSGSPAPKGSGSEAAYSNGESSSQAAEGANAIVKSAPSSASEQSKGGESVAGPAAMEVAHRFSEAFVLYEVGKVNAGVRSEIAATASPDLTQALLKRPPRMPANVKVPEAKVLNIVPGPKQGNAYTLSVSLLRLGATSELRIDMQKDKSGRWQVTDALG
jgi:hypothetical protein